MMTKTNNLSRFQVEDYIRKGYKCYALSPEIKDKELFSKVLFNRYFIENFFIGNVIFLKQRRDES